MQPRWTWHHWALVGLALLAAIGATDLAARACAVGDAPPTVLGLRLGATPDVVRARFAAARFETELAADVALVADGPLEAGVAPGARFEFHDGQLVAVRARLERTHRDAGGGSLVITPLTLLSRASEDDGSTSVVLLSRTCPTHREEASRLAGSESSDLP
jgi:hypothetical protein